MPGATAVLPEATFAVSVMAVPASTVAAEGVRVVVVALPEEVNGFVLKCLTRIGSAIGLCGTRIANRPSSGPAAPDCRLEQAMGQSRSTTATNDPDLLRRMTCTTPAAV